MVDTTLPLAPELGPLNSDTFTEQDPLSTDVGTASVLPSVQTAQIRASKADYGLAGATDKNYMQLFHGIMSGNEDEIRKQAASRLDSIKIDSMQRKVTDLMSSLQQMPKDLQPNAIETVNRLINSREPVDPRSVIEEGYSRQLIDALNWQSGNNYNTLDQASETGLEAMADQSQGMGQSVMAQREYALKKLADMEDLAQGRSIPSYVLDKGLGMFQIYNEFRQRSATGNFLGSLGLGNVHQQTYQDLLTSPFPDYKNKLDAIVDNLKSNPDQAISFLSGLIAPSTGQRHLDNAMSLLAPLDAYGFAKGSVGIARAAILRNSLNRAIKSQIAAAVEAPPLKPPNVVGPGSAGDLHTAAINQAANDAQELLSGVANTPVRQGLDALVSGFKDQLREIEADPGRMGQEGVNRIKEDTLGFIQNLTRGITNVLKVERLPGFLASKEAVATYYNKIKDLYPGFKNSILDMGNKIEWDSTTNTYHMPIYFGDGANYFSNAQIAYNKALSEGLVPAQETLLQDINKHFGERSSALTKKINDLKAQLREPSGPSTQELDIDSIRRELADTERQFDDLLAWHGDKLTEPGIDQIVTRTHPGGFEIGQKPTNPSNIKSTTTITVNGKSKTTTTLNNVANSDRIGELTRKIADLKSQLAGPSGPSHSEVDIEGINKDLVDAQRELSEERAKGFTIGQQGQGYFIKIVKPVNEVDQDIRKALLNPKVTSKWNRLTKEENTTPHNFFKDIFGWGRTPDEIMSAVHTANRKVAAYAPSVFMKLLKENATYLDSLYSGVVKKDALTGEDMRWVRNGGYDFFTGIGRPLAARGEAILKGTYLSPTVSRLADTKLGKKLFANGTRWNRFVRMLDSGRYMMDDVLDENGLPQNGYFFKTPGEFERNYASRFGQYPDAMETAAYFAFRRHYEADKVFRELVLYKNASRLGTEEHSIKYFDADRNPVESSYFPGIHMDHLPGGDDNIAVFNDRGLQWKGRANEMDINTAEKRREAIKQGKLKVIRLFAADQRPLNGYAGLTDEKIHYVVTPNAPTTRPLQLGNMLPRRGGGHIVYDYDHYIKQAIVRPDKIGERFNHWYEGDTTIMPISNRALGNKVAGHINQVRQYLKDGDTPNAKRYAQANLPIEWDELHSWFNPQKTPDGRIIPARLGMDEPVQVVQRNKLIGDIDNRLAERYPGTFRDGTKGGSPAEALKVQFAGQRDADLMYTINDYGTASRPLFKHEPAELLDPMVTLNRSLKQISNSYFMDDYKLYAVEHWLQEHWDILDTAFDKPKEEIMKSPFYYFYNGKFKPGALGQDFQRVSGAQLRRYQITNFLGTPSIIQQGMDWMSQHLADAAYEDRFYQRTVLGNHVSMVPSWLMHHALDPARKLRTAAYHGIIGMFNWAQLIAQSMNYVTMAGLAGNNAMHGSIGAILHQYARLLGPSAEMLADLDKVAVNVGLFKPGEWTEAFNLLRDTGYETVEGSHMMLDHIYTPKVVTNGVHHFLDAGDIFFKGGERNARFGAWYTAYKEGRRDKPLGRFTNLEKIKMLDRADFLSGNMSRASRSMLQTGIGELPTQFLGYTMRVAEQFTGSRIGWKARARLATTFALAFGIPQATSLTGFPMDKFIRQDALDPNQISSMLPGYKQFMQYAFGNGYVVGENFYKDLAMQGLPSMIVALASGAGDWKKGTQLNIGQRYGSPGLDIIRDALTSDKPTLQIVSGASGSFLQSMMQNTAGFRRAAVAAITGDSEHFKLKPEDLIEPLKIPSSSSYAWRSIHAINTLKWLSKNETVLAQRAKQDISPIMAAIMGLTGTQPQQVADLDLKSISHKNDLDQQRQAEKDFTKEWNRAAQALHDQDGTNAQDFLKRAYWILEQADYPKEKRAQLILRAEKGWGSSLIDRLNDTYNRINPPPSQAKGRLDQYRRERAVENYKAQ